MAVCRNCGTQYPGSKDLCKACLAASPACTICGRQIDDHSLMYSQEKYPKPACPPKNADMAGAAG